MSTQPVSWLCGRISDSTSCADAGCGWCSHGPRQSLRHHSVTLSLGGPVGKELVPPGRKKEPLRCELLSSRNCNTIFVECLVQNEYGNVTIRIGRLLASPQHMYINRIGRRRERRFEHSRSLQNIIWELSIDHMRSHKIKLAKVTKRSHRIRV